MEVGKINGIRLIKNHHMITYKETIQIKRTWGERLFSLPFRPFTKYKKRDIYEPSKEYILDKQNRVIYAHPETIETIISMIKDIP